MSRVVVNEIEAKVGNDVSFNDTVKIDTLKGKTTAGSIDVTGEGNSTTTNLQQGLAKAWVLGGDDASLTDSFNIASGTDNGTGDYTYAIANDMSNANFAGSVTGAGGGRRYGIQSSRTTGTFVVKLYDDNESAADNPNCSKVHGDLA